MDADRAARAAAEKEAWQGYLYPDSQILINKLGLNDERLWEAERFLARRRQEQIAAGQIDIPRTYDRAHFDRIHYELFHDVYSWAGQSRTVTIGKEGRWFMSPAAIEPWMDGVLKGSASVDWKSLGRKEVVAEISALFGNINLGHPYREGNGRTARLYLEHVMEQTPYTLDFDAIDAELWNAASRESIYPGLTRQPNPVNTEPLLPIFEQAVIDRPAPLITVVDQEQRTRETERATPVPETVRVESIIETSGDQTMDNDSMKEFDAIVDRQIASELHEIEQARQFDLMLDDHIHGVEYTEVGGAFINERGGLAPQLDNTPIPGAAEEFLAEQRAKAIANGERPPTQADLEVTLPSPVPVTAEEFAAILAREEKGRPSLSAAQSAQADQIRSAAARAEQLRGHGVKAKVETLSDRPTNTHQVDQERGRSTDHGLER